MSRVVVIERDPELQNIYSSNMQVYVGELPSVYSDFENLQVELENNEDLKVVLIRLDEKEKELLDTALKMNQERSHPAHFVVISSKLEESDLQAGTLVRSCFDMKPIIKSAAQALGVTAEQMASLEVPNYFSFQSNLLLKIDHAVVDLFSEVEGSFVKSLARNTPLDENFIQKFQGAATENVFVNRNDRVRFINGVTQEFVSRVDLSKFSADEKTQAFASNQALLRNRIRTIGVNPETVALAKKSLNQSLKLVKGSKGMKDMLDRMRRNRTGFMFKHVQVLTFLAHHLMEHLSWGGEEQKEKMSFIALFHDITLETDEQARINSPEEFAAANLSKEERDLVDKHAQLSAQLVEKFPRSPIGVDQIIRQHHGILHGIGFSETFSTNLSPMTIVFAVAEEAAIYMIDREDYFEPRDMIEHLRAKFKTSRFKKIIDLMETLAF